MNLKEDNRWVKKAQIISWNKIEKKYAALFTNRKGNVAKSVHLALGACIIQAEYGYSDEKTALQIQENPYLQYFCSYPGYDDKKPPFDPSLMVYFRKHLTPEILGSVNEMIIAQATKSDEKNDENEESNEEADSESESVDDDDSDNSNDSDDNDDDPDNGSGTANIYKNSGTMIIDATCAPSDIVILRISLCLMTQERKPKS